MSVFFHTVVHGCSLAVSVGGCVLALCREHVCGQRCCLVDQPLELSESHFTLRHLRSVLRTVVWSCWRSIHGVPLS